MALGTGVLLFLFRIGSQVPVANQTDDFAQGEVELDSRSESAAHAPTMPYSVKQPLRAVPREFRQESRSIPRWSIIVLGSLLVILGGLVFGREKTRPGALKMATFLGIGAIIYLVGTFVGDPPRLPNPHVIQVHADARLSKKGLQTGGWAAGMLAGRASGRAGRWPRSAQKTSHCRREPARFQWPVN